MSHSSEQEIMARLSHVPCGKPIVNHLSDPCAHSALSACHRCAMCDRESKAQLDTLTLYPGVELCFQTYLSSSFTHRHSMPSTTVMEINHCRTGRIGWRMKDGLSLYLGEGDVSLHSMSRCTQSEIEFPLHCYEGLFFSVDLDALDANPPELMQEAGVSARGVYERFCQENSAVLSACPQNASIFDGLYTIDRTILLPYARLKFQELMLVLSRTPAPVSAPTPYKADQIAVVRQIHEELLSDLGQRRTIEELSKRYLMNPSTLKDVFKFVYGQPIAAHMKEHRLERAALLLRTTDDSLSEIAAQVGYESQSKFSSAFKSVYGVLPREYRKQSFGLKAE